MTTAFSVFQPWTGFLFIFVHNHQWMSSNSELLEWRQTGYQDLILIISEWLSDVSVYLLPDTRGAFVLGIWAAFCFTGLDCVFTCDAFFEALVALAFSFAALMACSLWALRTSGFWFLLALICSRETPTIARWNFVARLVLFLDTSSWVPFLCLRR